MKPADLLADLETGDRTMEHLKDKPDPETSDFNDAVRYVMQAGSLWGNATWGLGATTGPAFTYHTAQQLGAQQAQAGKLQAQANTTQQLFGAGLSVGLMR